MRLKMGNKVFQTSNIDMLILSILLQKDMYGYELIQVLNEKSKMLFELKAGTIYPLLHSLEKEGLVVSYEKETDSGKVRKYYSITESGRIILTDKKEKWKEYYSAINHVLGW